MIAKIVSVKICVGVVNVVLFISYWLCRSVRMLGLGLNVVVTLEIENCDM